jgi:hypothetical protein
MVCGGGKFRDDVRWLWRRQIPATGRTALKNRKAMV